MENCTMSSLLLIRHGESEYNAGKSTDLDSKLTGVGMTQICLTAEWLASEFDLLGYVGFTSPYQRTLQSASVLSEITGVNFAVDDNIREYHLNKKIKFPKEGLTVPSQCAKFSNLIWSKEYLSRNNTLYPNETLEAFVGRIDLFLYTLQQNKYEKVMIMTHGSPIRVLSELSTGNNVEALEARYLKNSDALSVNDLPKINNSSMTWIKDGEIKWFSKCIFE